MDWGREKNADDPVRKQNENLVEGPWVVNGIYGTDGAHSAWATVQPAHRRHRTPAYLVVMVKAPFQFSGGGAAMNWRQRWIIVRLAPSSGYRVNTFLNKAAALSHCRSR